MIILSAFLIGCANQPIPYPRASMPLASEQLLIQSASHWNILANNEADYIVQEFQNEPSLYISEKSKNTSPFIQAYHEMLISNLVQNGGKVFTSPTNSTYQLEYEVQTVIHNKEDFQRLRPGMKTAFVLSAATVLDLLKGSEPELALIPITAMGELWNAFHPDSTPEITEVVINTRITDENQIILASSRVYYFNASDMQNYDKGRPFPVVSARGQ